MTRRAAALLLGVLAAAVAVIVLWTRPQVLSPGKRRARAFLRATPSPAPAATVLAGTPAVTPPETVRVTLFFLDKDGKLEAEERDIPKPSGPSAYLKALFTELAHGPTRAGLVAVLPSKISLRGAYLLTEGLAVLDLAVDSGLSFGGSEELAIVAAVVNTVLQNVADTNRVRLLINGEPAETLGGHVDLTQPLSYIRDEVAR
jgi:germination protein M